MNTNINFPHLHLFFENVGQSIQIGSFPIAFYGIIISLAIMVGIMIALREAKRTGQKDNCWQKKYEGCILNKNFCKKRLIVNTLY